MLMQPDMGAGYPAARFSVTAALAKLCPWMATPRSSSRTVSGRSWARRRTLSGRRSIRVILLAASWLPAITKTADALVPQPAELPDQVQPRVVIAPIAVVEVSRD